MSRRTLIEQRLLRRMESLHADGRAQTASQLAVGLRCGVDSVRRALTRLREQGIVAPDPHITRERDAKIWHIVHDPADAGIDGMKERKAVSEEQLAQAGYTWNIDAADTESARAELERIEFVVRERFKSRNEAPWPVPMETLHIIIRNCEHFAEGRVDEMTADRLRDIAHRLARASVRVQLRSTLNPSKETIPSALWFLSLLDDDLVTFLHEPVTS